MGTLITNKKANFNYNIIETFEAGMVLSGSEVKSIKSKEVSLAEAYIKIDAGEAWIYGMHINPWKFSIIDLNFEPTRRRKLLLKKQEIYELEESQKLKGVAIIPVNLHLKRGKIKLSIGLAKGLKKHDKRQKEKIKELKSDIRSKEKEVW